MLFISVKPLRAASQRFILLKGAGFITGHILENVDDLFKPLMKENC